MRSLKDTPSSVAVASQQEIEAASTDRVEQVLAAIPNIQLGTGSQGPAIRGQDSTGALQALPAFLGGNRPRTTIVVDGRPVTYNEFVFGVEPVWDVERIEVFRSPQTTTQGQNSIAGAIFVTTNAPNFEPEYRVRGTLGNLHTRQVSALASGPLGGEVAVRVAGDLRYSRTTSRIADRAEGVDPNHDVYGQLRAKLLAEPAALPGTRLTLTYSHLRSQAPQLVGLTRPFRQRRDEGGFYGTFRINVDSLTAAAEHDSGAITARLLVTAGDSHARRFAFPHFGQTRNDGRDLFAEAVLNWAPEEPLRATGGVSHSHVGLKQFIDLSLRGMIGRFRDRQDATGLFGEASYEFAPRMTLTAGIRYQHDRQRRTGVLDAGDAAIPLDFDGKFHAWLPKVSLGYDVSPALRVGALVEKAYNPGGTTLRFDSGRPDEFAAESLWDYELFARATTSGGRLTLGANLFRYSMHNAQRAKDILLPGPGGFNVGFSDLFNVPKARSQGAEAELRWRASERLSARVAVGLLKTRILRTDPAYPEFADKAFDRSPKFSGSASVDWTPAPLLRLSAQARHHSGYWSDPTNDPASRVDSGTIVDARGEHQIGRAAVFAYARNIFNTLSLTTTDGVSATAEDPREIGIGIEARF